MRRKREAVSARSFWERKGNGVIFLFRLVKTYYNSRSSPFARGVWYRYGQAVLAAAGGGGDWADLYSAVDSARRLCIFHSGVLVREGNLEGAVGLMVTAVGNLRSSMVRNALLGVGDMFR